MEWKIAVIVTAETQRHLLPSYSHLASLKLIDFDVEGLHVFCPSGVKVNEGERVIRHRSRDAQITTEREVWIDALKTMSSTYASTTDLFLFTTPQLIFWNNLRRFCEATVEPNYVSLYFPFTPDPLFEDSPAVSLPCRAEDHPGWCETRMSEASEAFNAIVLHRHAARVLASYLDDQKNVDYPCWKTTLAHCLNRMQSIRCYCSSPSFAQKRVTPSFKGSYQEPVLEATNFKKRLDAYLN